MCKFEDCWDNDKCKIIRDSKIISNIKPEIGKIRPVVIIYAHKRAKLAVVIPFTTSKPSTEISNTLHIPVGIMPGVLGRTECWALCDMPQTICTDRLATVFSGDNDNYYRRFNQTESILRQRYFQEITTILKKLLG